MVRLLLALFQRCRLCRSRRFLTLIEVLARVVLWAEWQAGHQLRIAERTHPGPQKVMSQAETQPGFYALINDHNLDKNTAYRWIMMSFAPRVLDVFLHPVRDAEVVAARALHRPCSMPVPRPSESLSS